MNNDFNGDGSLLIIYSLSIGQIKELSNEFKTNDYKLLPIKNYGVFLMIEKFININDNGYYNWLVKMLTQ